MRRIPWRQARTRGFGASRSGSPSASRRAPFVLAAAAAALVALDPAAAAQLQLSPTRFNLTPAAPTAVLTVSNRGGDNAALQLGVMTWDQPEGDDRLTPTRDVLGNPGLFAVPANSQQIARIGLRVPPLAVERSYRLIVREVPQPNQGSGLVTLLTISVPVFVPPDKPMVAVDWRLRVGAAGPEIVVHNNGNVHVQLTGLKLAAADGTSRLDQAMSFYVLPGATRAFPIKPKAAIAPGATIKLHADSDQGELFASMLVEAAGNVPARP